MSYYYGKHNSDSITSSNDDNTYVIEISNWGWKYFALKSTDTDSCRTNIFISVRWKSLVTSHDRWKVSAIFSHQTVHCASAITDMEFYKVWHNDIDK